MTEIETPKKRRALCIVSRARLSLEVVTPTASNSPADMVTAAAEHDAKMETLRQALEPLGAYLPDDPAKIVSREVDIAADPD